MNPFNFHVPTRIVFGIGCANTLGALLSKQGVESALIITDRGVRRASCVTEVIDSLDSNGIGYDVFD
ncbi:MAG: iron-containing alcohol dehydrogenase, partial [Euryarchaeota archaeon]|nr:iron-containing alcohol dehydrogenase [Euryarchaeota archaeon]